jgi:glycosyl transferase family 1
VIDSPLRFTFVIARYGAETLGGAEKQTRAVAERLVARGHDVRVLTTRARSHATWANDLPARTSFDNGVEVQRYTAAPRRRPWDDVCKWMSGRCPSSDSIAHAWVRAQGPVARALIDRLPGEARERDLVIFFQLLSHLTIAGMPRIAARSALVPFVHDEPPVYTRLAGRTLTMPRALLANTDAEAARIARAARGPLPPIEIAGAGLDTPPPPAPCFVRPTSHPYLIVMGRMAKSAVLAATWRALAQSDNLPPLDVGGASIPWSEVRLVTAGERSRLFERLPNVEQAGFVSDAQRWDLLRGAVALVNPSVHESLSLVLLESWAISMPVVVHARCDVTAGHVRSCGGGLAVDFSQPAGAAAQIANGLRAEADRGIMGARGAAYARRSFVWDAVLDAYERVALAARRAAPDQAVRL